MQVGLALATVRLLNTPTVLVLRYRNFPKVAGRASKHRPAQRGVQRRSRYGSFSAVGSSIAIAIFHGAFCVCVFFFLFSSGVRVFSLSHRELDYDHVWKQQA